MIRTFRDRLTAAAFVGQPIKGLGPDVRRTAQKKLRELHRVAALDELRIRPGNRLEKLKGDREGQWSVRVNDQWRLCFVWQDGHAFEVELVDYH